MKLTNGQLPAFTNALEMLSPSMGDAQRAMAVASVTMPRLKGNLNYPLLAYRVGRAKRAITGFAETYNSVMRAQLAATRVKPPVADGADVPPEDQWPSDANKFNAAMALIHAETIEFDAKPLTWDILIKAGVVGGAPAKEGELEFDGSFVAALGDFLDGEPPENLG